MLATTMEAGGPGGVAVVTRLAAEVLAAGIGDVEVVSLNDDPAAAWLEEWPGSTACGGSRARFIVEALARSRRARQGLVLAMHVGASPVARLLKALSGARQAVFLHGVEVWKPLPLRSRWGLASADLVVANSRFTLERFRATQPWCARVPGEVSHLPARTLPWGEPVLRSAVPVVLVVGRLWGRGLRKGQDLLIRVWPSVREEVPDAELHIVGDGEGRGALEELAASSPCPTGIRFMGAVSDHDLGIAYRSAWAYAMPSEGEGFGLVFAEAMAHGLPCIASSVDAGAEVVVDGETGIVVAPGDEPALRQAVVAVLRDAGLRSRMGEAGRRRAEEAFGMAAFSDRMCKLARRVMGGAHGG